MTTPSRAGQAIVAAGLAALTLMAATAPALAAPAEVTVKSGSLDSTWHDVPNPRPHGRLLLDRASPHARGDRPATTAAPTPTQRSTAHGAAVDPTDSSTRPASGLDRRQPQHHTTDGAHDEQSHHNPYPDEEGDDDEAFA